MTKSTELFYTIKTSTFTLTLSSVDYYHIKRLLNVYKSKASTDWARNESRAMLGDYFIELLTSDASF